jgi:parallel beta-helix repeat protein
VKAYCTAVVLSIAALAACGSTAGDYAAGPPGVVSVACTDSASDAANLQHAINSSAPGADIEIQGGTCLLTTGITLLSDRTYTGENTSGTVLQQGGDMGYVLASDTYVDNASTTGEPLAVQDLTIECDGTGSTDGIIILNWLAEVEEVDVSGCGGSGIVDTNTTANGSAISNSSVNSRFDDNFISDSGQNGFEVHDSRNSVTDGFLDNNQISSSGQDAIHLDNAAGWNISGNHLYGNTHNGIYASRVFGTTISDNYIEDFGDKQESGTWYGIICTVQGSVGSTISDNKISNDKGEDPGARYVYVGVAQVNYGTGYLSVTGNVIVGVRSSDVGFSFGGGSNELVVASSGNEVAQVGTVTSDARGVTRTSGTLAVPVGRVTAGGTVHDCTACPSPGGDSASGRVSRAERPGRLGHPR